MRHMRSLAIILAVAAAISLLWGCGGNGGSGAGNSGGNGSGNGSRNGIPRSRVTLTVSAAASLKNAMEELKEIYRQEKPGVKIDYNFGASGVLQQQIEQGAGVDIFISAASKQMDALQKQKLVAEGTRVDLLGNRVVLVVPEGTRNISDFSQLKDSGVKKVALGEPKGVPAGQYAEEVLSNMGLLESIKQKAVYGSDVEQVLTWVATGNADAGIVYETDAESSGRVRVAAVAPEDTHRPVIYPAAVMASSRNMEAAADFMKFLSGPRAKAVFEELGFTFLKKPEVPGGKH